MTLGILKDPSNKISARFEEVGRGEEGKILNSRGGQTGKYYIWKNSSAVSVFRGSACVKCGQIRPGPMPMKLGEDKYYFDDGIIKDDHGNIFGLYEGSDLGARAAFFLFNEGGREDWQK